MAVLSDANRYALWGQYMSDASARRDALPLSKADLRAAVNAVDAWVDANAAVFNLAIPQPARSALTAKQKADLLRYVVGRRWEVA